MTRFGISRLYLVMSRRRAEGQHAQEVEQREKVRVRGEARDANRSTISLSDAALADDGLEQRAPVGQVGSAQRSDALEVGVLGAHVPVEHGARRSSPIVEPAQEVEDHVRIEDPLSGVLGEAVSVVVPLEHAEERLLLASIGTAACGGRAARNSSTARSVSDRVKPASVARRGDIEACLAMLELVVEVVEHDG